MGKGNTLKVRTVNRLAAVVASVAIVIGATATSSEAAVPVQRQAACVSSSSIGFGARGEQVKTVQSWLRKAGFNPGPIDGWFWKKTRAAVRRAERAYGWTVDGRLSKQELWQMGIVCQEASTSPTPTPTPTPTPAPTPTPTPVADQAGLSSPVEVRIPRLGMVRRVVDGGDNAQPVIDSCVGAVVVHGFATPVYLAAHRTSCGSSGFNGVETLQIGDVIEVAYASGVTVKYRVGRVVDSTAGTWVADPAGGAPVALQTSLSGGRVRIISAWQTA